LVIILAFFVIANAKHLQIDAKTREALTLSYLQYNIDMTIKEEKFMGTQWQNRKGRVAAIIDAYDAD